MTNRTYEGGKPHGPGAQWAIPSRFALSVFCDVHTTTKPLKDTFFSTCPVVKQHMTIHK